MPEVKAAIHFMHTDLFQSAYSILQLQKNVSRISTIRN